MPAATAVGKIVAMSGLPLRLYIAGQIYERLQGANGWLIGADGSPVYGRKAS